MQMLNRGGVRFVLGRALTRDERVQESDELLRRRLRRSKGSGFPVVEEALNAYAVIEFESPRLVANAQDITLDGHLVQGHVE